MTNEELNGGALLRVSDLRASFFTPAGEVRAVEGTSFSLARGEALGVVGESGCGKSATLLSIMGLLGGAGRVLSGRVELDGRDLTALSPRAMADIRGRRVSMIFQDPMTSLNPVLPVGYQLEEPLRRHGWPGGRAARRKRVLEALDRVGVVPAERRAAQFPFQFSGGQRQRLMIAMAMICGPDLLLADEPTTALDVTVQAQILELMTALRARTGMALVLVTHDLGVVAGAVDRVLVMYGGRIVERGTRRDIFYEPAHPYTRGLLRSIPNPELPGRLVPIEGQPPDLLHPPAGCPYVPRCPEALRVCALRPPEERALSATHGAACWLLRKEAR